MLNFQAPKWLSGPHRQTTFPHLFRKKPFFHWFRERLELPNGDFIDVDTHIVSNKPIVILLHGLEGSSSSSYVYGAAYHFLSMGWGVVAYNLPSCGGSINRLPSYYHSGFTSDFRFLIQVLQQRYADQPLLGLGFSLGGNILLRYAGEPNCLLSAAMAVSTPIALSSSTHTLRHWQARFYEQRFLRLLKKKVTHKRKKLEEIGIVYDDVLKAKTLRLFDRHLTAPTFGFVDEEDYYQRAASLPLFPYISIPTLLLQSYDDPMLSQECYPDPKTLNSNISCVYTQTGGHVGFVYGTPKKPRFFAEEEAERFFLRVFDT